MPTILVINGFRFYFFSADGDELAHVHVEKGNGKGKIWLEPSIEIAELVGFKIKEQKKNLQLVEENYDLLKQKWYGYFDNSK